MSASGNVLIRNVLVYGEGEPTDLLLGGGQILEIGTGLDAGDDVEVIDGAGQILLPGFVDMHTHLREPGREDTETIDTVLRLRLSAGTPPCSRWRTPARSPTRPSSPITCGAAARKWASSTCTRSAQSRSASRAANSPRWRRWPPVSAR